MGVQVVVQPAQLPHLRKGDRVLVRVFLKGARQSELIQVTLEGAQRLDGQKVFQMTTHQATTFHPAASITIQATEDGSPSITVHSPTDRFTSVRVNGHPVLSTRPPPFGGGTIVHYPEPQVEVLDNPQEDDMSDSHDDPDSTPTTPPPEPQVSSSDTTTLGQANEGRPSMPPPQERRSWWPAILGAATCLLLAAGLLLWRISSNDSVEPQAQVAEPELTAEQIEMIEAASREVETEQMAVTAPAPEPAPPTQATPAPEPPAPAPEVKPAASASSGAASSSHTNCGYIDGSWPMVGSKYVVRCNEGVFLATQGAYKGGGVYEFKDFEVHNN